MVTSRALILSSRGPLSVTRHAQLTSLLKWSRVILEQLPIASQEDRLCVSYNVFLLVADRKNASVDIRLDARISRSE